MTTNRYEAMTDEDLARFVALRARVFEHLRAALARDTHCKSYEGAMELHTPCVFGDDWRLVLHCYLLGPTRHYAWQAPTFAECLTRAAADIDGWIADDVEAWRAEDAGVDEAKATREYVEAIVEVTNILRTPPNPALTDDDRRKVEEVVRVTSPPPPSPLRVNLAETDVIELGFDGSPRMDLSREMVAALLPRLERFVETGELSAEGNE